MVNPGWCTRLFGLESSSVLYRTLFLYLNNDVVSPLLTPHTTRIHSNGVRSSSTSYLNLYMSSLYSGLEILHQREGLIATAECERIGSSSSMYDFCYEVVAQIIVAKSVSEVLKFCELCQQYGLLDSYYINPIKGVPVCDLCIIYSKFV